MTSKISFTIRPPPQYKDASASRKPQEVETYVPHAVDSSDEDENEDKVELVTGFDEAGIKRLHERPKQDGPLIIPALPNRDWRAIARQRKKTTQIYLPGGADNPIGPDGSIGGLGMRDTINAGPQATGLVVRQVETMTTERVEGDSATVEKFATITDVEMDEDEQARRSLLQATSGDTTEDIVIDSIPLTNRRAMDETEAYKEDVVTRPESATLADYERVPVSQFGAALLRGMGWKEGTAASRTRRGPVEPYLPAARPSLLGLGAKERAPDEVPSSANNSGRSTPAGTKRQDKRYIPLARVRREDSSRPASSRSQSRSPPPPPSSRISSRMPSSAEGSPYPEYAEEKNRKERDGDRYSSRREYDRERGREGEESEGKRERRDRELDGHEGRRDKRDRNREKGRRERSRDYRRDSDDDSKRRDRDNERDRQENRNRDRRDDRRVEGRHRD